MARSKSSKIILVLVVVIVLGAAAGIAAAIFHKKDSDKNTPVQTTSSQTPVKSNNPKVVLSSIKSYTGQNVTLDGVISKVQNDYYLVGLDKDKPGAIKLDLSKTSVDPTKYIAQTAQSTAPTSPGQKVKVVQPTVSVTGKVYQKNTSSQPTLIVTSIKQN